MHEDLVLGLIDKVYAAAEDATLWPPFLDAFADAIASAQTSLVFRDMQTAAGFAGASVRIDPHYATLYEHYSDQNFFMTAGAPLMKKGAIITSDSLFSDAEILRRGYYNDYLKPQKIFHSVGFVLFHDDRTTATVIATRPRQRGIYTDEEIQIGRALMPHLQRAYGMHQRLSALTVAASDAAATIERLATGVIVLDSSGRIQIINSAARKHLEAGAPLRTNNDFLSADSDGGALDAALKRALDPAGVSGPHVVQLQRRDRWPMILTVIPLRRQSFPGTSAQSAVVFIDDPEIQPIADSSVFRQVFGFSPAETRLARLLLARKSLTESAESLRISIHTARTQLKQMLAKTRTSRQSDLLLLLDRTTGRRTPAKAPDATDA